MHKHLGTVVQNVVSLTSPLRVISLTVLVDSIYNILIYFAEKMRVLTFFSKKFQHICVSLDVNLNESLTNDVVSFEQLGPGMQGNRSVSYMYKQFKSETITNEHRYGLFV